MRHHLFIILSLLGVYGYAYTPVTEKIALPEVTLTGTMHCVGSNVYVSTDDGIYSLDITSPDAGWECTALNGRLVTGFVVSGDKFIATVMDAGSAKRSSVIVSSDEVKPIAPYDIEEAYLLAFDNCASSPDNIVAYITDPTRTYGSKSGLAFSNDGGVTWTKTASSPMIYDPKICVHPSEPATFAVLTHSGFLLENVTYVAVTSDNGATWPTKNMEIYGAPQDICFNPYDRNIMIAPSCELIHISADQGKEWTKVNIQNQLGRHVTARKVFYDTTDPSTLYLVEITDFSNGHYYAPSANSCSPEEENPRVVHFVIIKSEDGGATWSEWYCEDLPDGYGYQTITQCGDCLLTVSNDSLDILRLKDESAIPSVADNSDNISVVFNGSELTVSAESAIKAITVTDIAGRTVACVRNDSDDRNVTARLTAKGPFIITVTTDEATFVTKAL